MNSYNIQQPGQINYDKQQALLDSLPNDTSSLQEIQRLLSNPASPFAQFLLLGKQEQINKALAADARQKALQSDQGGPPPTIAQKTQQMSGILALQNAQRNAIGAPSPAAVTPAGGIPRPVPQPAALPVEEQAEPEQATERAASGGIMHAPVDPRMFDFAGGGIVAFANPESEKKQLVQETYAERDKRMHEQPALTSYDDPYSVDKLEQSAKDAGNSFINLFPKESGIRKISDYINAGRPGPSMSLYDYLTQSSNAPSTAAALTSDTTPAAAAVQPGASDTRLAMLSDPRVQEAIVNAGKQGINLSQTGQMVAPGSTTAPAASAAPGSGIAGGVSLPPSNVNASPAGILALAKSLKMDNPFEAEAIAELEKNKPETYSQKSEVERIKSEGDAFDLGKFSENRRAQLDNLEKMFQANRPSTLEQLLELGHAYSARGARFGDVGATGARQMREEREAQMQFAQAKDKVLESIEKEDQAIRTGNVAELRAARKEKAKDLQEWNKLGISLKETLAKNRTTANDAALQTAGHIIGQQISSDAQLRAAQLHLLAAQATANKPSEAERFEKLMKETYAAAEKEKPGSGTAAVEALVKTRMTAESAVQGRKYDQPDKAVEHENMIQSRIKDRVGFIDAKLQNPKLKPEERDKLLATRREIEKDVRRQFPFKPGAETTTPPPAGGDQVYQPRTEDDIKNIPSGAIFVNPADGKRYKKN
jgi:hypothetical protein